ncbi:daptide-type RiPP biosynthesis methyltransferase [Streptomyces aureoverticillatus]|uniref:daptide-type RiPP biosynthesis methyltransferase n=1 Tax=Streptomyces aureoverticillatus TaxID=66871 RepID=UPI0013DA4411|nr:daptide-type RiPP biosynthesis methyltransferase [Streptomyces aureoverticillatus]QIB45417.1 class I SAM-dependent methyltransferase [Streptomyces aureoverticillatus]
MPGLPDLPGSPGLPGLAGRIARSLGDSLTVAELYGPVGGPIYHELTAGDTNEVRDVLALLRGTQEQVLELACGSGRLTLPLLAAGHQVTGVDTSRSLLSQLRGRLSEPSAQRLAQRLTLVEADMCALDLPQQFAAALLGTTTIGLVPPAARPGFFRTVREHLEPGGLFVLSAHTPSTEDDGPSVRPVTTPHAVNFVIDEAEPLHAQRRVAILRIPAQGGPVLLTSTVHVPSPDTLAEELQDAGFGLDEVRTARPTAGAPSELSILVARSTR